MTTSSDFDEAVAARTVLLEQAKRVLPEAKLDALDERSVQELVLKKIYGAALDLADKSPAYLRGLYQHAVSAGRLDAASGGTTTEPAVAPAPQRDLTPDWQQPLSFGRDGDPEFIQRGGVARDRHGTLLADWQQPLSYNIRPQYRYENHLPPKSS